MVGTLKNKIMETKKAGMFKVQGQNPFWKIALESVVTYSSESNDQIIIDSEWLRENEDDPEGHEDDLVLIEALDGLEELKAWREVDLLYVWPA
jgi:hypothetical protein